MTRLDDTETIDLGVLPKTRGAIPDASLGVERNRGFCLSLFENVQCRVSIPPRVVSGKTALLRIDFAPEFSDPGSPGKFALPEQQASGRLSDGEQISLHLHLPGFELLECTVSFPMSNKPEAICFPVTASAESIGHHCRGNIMVCVSDAQIPIGHLELDIEVASPRCAVNYTMLEDNVVFKRYENVFAAYAWKDCVEVRKRVERFPDFGLSICDDLLHRNPEQRWREELFRQIDHCDVMLLFWSPAAERSPWVREEVRYALRANVATSGQHPLVAPVVIGPTQPWEELQGLNFTAGLKLCSPA